MVTGVCVRTRWRSLLNAALVKSLFVALLMSLPAAAEETVAADGPGIGSPKTLSISTAYVGSLGWSAVPAKKELYRGFSPGMSVSALMSFNRAADGLPAWFYERIRLSLGLNATAWRDSGAWAASLPVEVRLDLLTGGVKPWFGVEGRAGWLVPPSRLPVKPGPAVSMGAKAGLEVAATEWLRVGAQGAWVVGVGGDAAEGSWFETGGGVSQRWFELGLGVTFLL